MNSPLLDVKEVAQILSYHPNQIYRLAKQGKIPYLKIGGQYRFIRKSLDDWLEGLIQAGEESNR